MAALEYIITPDDIRDICLPNKTFDINKFQPHIYPAELQYIKPFLGADLYNAIRTQYLADTLTSANETLLTDYLKPMLAWYTLAKSSPFMHTELRSAGFFNNNSEYSTTASDKQRADLYTVMIQNAEALSDLAKEYIEDNLTSYPLYETEGNIDNTTGILGGIITDID